jgi:hypothetical protein
VARFGSFLERLARPPEEVRAENLRHWVSTLPETMPIADVQPRERCRVAGVVQNIRIDPRTGRDSIEATIIDGSGAMIAKWLGRSSLQGVRLGVGLIVEGIAGKQEDDLVILNPEYTLVPGPEHG